MSRRKSLLSRCLCGLMLLTVTGCSGDKDPNADRCTDKQYDFVDYMDIEVFGGDGNGYLQITPKNINVNDFDSEQEYIAVKKLLDEMDLTSIPDGHASRYLKISQSSELSSGDEVVIKIRDAKEENLSVDMCIHPYTYVVPTLEESENIDLFDSNIVTFYGLSGTSELGYIINNNSGLNEEITSNLVYEMSCKDKELIKDETILEVTVDIDSDYLNDPDSLYHSLDVYLAKLGKKAETSKSKVLTNIAVPVELKTYTASEISSFLFDSLNSLESENGRTLIQIGSIQKLNTQGKNDPYSFVIVYQTEEAGENKVYTANVRMCDLNGELVLVNLERGSRVDAKYLTESLNNHELLDIYYIETESSEDVVNNDDVGEEAPASPSVN